MTAPYRTIVIDPPWPVKKVIRRVRPNQIKALDYPTMTLEEIAGLPIVDLTDPNGCHVYLWVTHKYLPIGFEIFQHWGVKYHCLLTWVKNVGFTPFSWMFSTEHVLFGRIGNLDVLKQGVRTSFYAPVIRHSKKPLVFYVKVCDVSPAPRLEMFAREPHEGFDSWGNEVQSSFQATLKRSNS